MLTKRKIQFVWLCMLLLASFTLAGGVMANSPSSFNSQWTESNGIGILLQGCQLISNSCTTYNHPSCCSSLTGNLTETHCTKKELCNGNLVTTTTISQGCGSMACHLSFDS